MAKCHRGQAALWPGQKRLKSTVQGISIGADVGKLETLHLQKNRKSSPVCHHPHGPQHAVDINLL